MKLKIPAAAGLLFFSVPLFEFSRFYPSDYAHGRDFVADLDRFFSQLPKASSVSLLPLPRIREMTADRFLGENIGH